MNYKVLPDPLCFPGHTLLAGAEVRFCVKVNGNVIAWFALVIACEF